MQEWPCASGRTRAFSDERRLGDVGKQHDRLSTDVAMPFLCQGFSLGPNRRYSVSVTTLTPLTLNTPRLSRKPPRRAAPTRRELNARVKCTSKPAPVDALSVSKKALVGRREASHICGEARLALLVRTLPCLSPDSGLTTCITVAQLDRALPRDDGT
jgi:hypothetical protein